MMKLDRPRKRNARLGWAVVAIAAAGAVIWFLKPDLASAVGRLNPKWRDGAASAGPIIAAPDFFSESERVCSRDLAYLATFCDRAISAGKGREGRYENTRKMLREALDDNPQTTWFVYSKASGRSWLSPDGPIPSKPTTEAKADIAIVGGELSALCSAVEAADRGYDVAIVYAGPLGGISADNGANLRYFDVMPKTSHPAGQQKIWRYLKVPGYCALPKDMDRKLQAFFKAKYFKNVQLIKAATYDDLRVKVRGGRLVEIVTPEKVAVRAARYIDMDPESRVAEKCGIKMSTDTQHLSYGLVFDLSGIRPQDWNPMGDKKRMTPGSLAKFAEIDIAEVKKNPAAMESMRKLRKFNSTSYNIIGASYRLGYQALAQGFDFYMRCRGIARPDDPLLKWLNGRRCVSGFNIATNTQGTGTFNSISYKFKQSILQHSHSLKEDDLFLPIRQYEMPALQRYFQWVTGNNGLKARMPDQLYVRPASAFFATKQPYVKAEFNKPSTTPFHTYYPMDLRDLHLRDAYSWPIILGYVKKAKYSHFWDCRPSATMTSIENLYLVNRSAATPVFYGGQRIEGNQINMGAALIASFGTPKPDRTK